MRFIFSLNIVFIILVSCSTYQLNIKYVPPLNQTVSKIPMGGAAIADITPPPNFPMAGFSSLSEYNKGFRAKLYAKVIYLKSENGQSIALVQCDLLSGSLILHHKVAELIAPYTDIDSSSLLISGSHTHSGPGQYFESNFYNDYASNSAGFDPVFFNFLCSQISKAIIEAFNNQKPIKIAIKQSSISGLTINRSFPAYLKNKNIQKSKQLTPLNAVNPDFYLIRIDAKDTDSIYKPFALITSYSIHLNAPPTLIQKLSNADIFGYFSRQTEQTLQKKYQTSWPVIHASFNQTCGDNNPYFHEKNDSFEELEKTGKILSHHSIKDFESLDSKLKDKITINSNSKEINLQKHTEIRNIKISDKPAIGCALIAGALGKPVSAPIIDRLIPFSAGNPRKGKTDSLQGEKKILLGPFQTLIIPTSDFPHLLYLQILQINEIAIAAIPTEITYEMGKRIKNHLESNLKDLNVYQITTVIPIGYSNGYFGYITTPEEYSLQFYEGGHNLYGPLTGDFISYHLSEILLEFNQLNLSKMNHSDLQWNFNLKKKDYLSSDLDFIHKREVFSNPSIKDDNSYAHFKWIDLPYPLIEFHKPLVSIEMSNDLVDWLPVENNGNILNDKLDQISVIYCTDYIPFSHFNYQSSDNQYHFRSIYEVQWHNPSRKNGYYYRFKIEPRNNMKVFYSPVF